MSISIGHERLRTLYSILAGLPDERVNLQSWRSKVAATEQSFIHDCGTTGCAVGWAMAFPEFRAQGFGREIGTNQPKYWSHGQRGFYDWEAVSAFFNLTLDEAELLFIDRNFSALRRDPLGIRGRAFCKDEQQLTSKETAMRRIRRFLMIKGVITPERNLELAKQEGTPE